MAVLAEVEPGHRVLEPSAGTGNLIDAIRKVQHPGHLVAVELNVELAERLRAKYQPGDATVKQADFLECNGDLGPFDRIVMNPPFKDGADIRHIEHARGLLAPGGRLVALCAAGPRQAAKLKPAASSWTDLGARFKEAGTSVHVALVVFDRA
jgi:16S rRNA G1207 methylase RsmC